MDRLARRSATPIAITGMGCRFPQASGADALWTLLLGNTDAVTLVPADRFDADAHHHHAPGTPGMTVSRHGGFLTDPFAFDAGFFGVSPVEARTMDPQQRVLLQVVWEALEDAGTVPSSLAGTRAGVFVGQATAEYTRLTGSQGAPDIRDVTGSRLRAMTAGRISHALDLRGPSLVLDTACSSSLVAVHAARQSLLAGESSAAVAAGVNLIFTPDDAIAYSQVSMLSPDGRCKFGSAGADGFVRSEGVGAVVLKRLPDALRDGDRVLALLMGSAVSNDGRSNGLLLHPAVAGQIEMLREACDSAGITPADLDYLEAHGTGTPAGDGVELRALTEALASAGSTGRRLRVGSVKSNIGHTEAAAGIAGLIKAVLVVRHGTIPASLHADPPTPLLNEEDARLELVRRNTPLAPAGARALVGVSAFGLSGTNAHAVVGAFLPTDVPRPDPATAPREQRAPASAAGPHLLVVSARSQDSLRRLARSYAGHLRPGGRGADQDLRAICATAALHREAHPHRLWVIGNSHQELADRLCALADGEHIADGAIAEAVYTRQRRTVFVFPGQGSQWLGMGRGLLASSPAFRAALAACDAAVQAELGWSVLELLTREADTFPSEVETVQPALWAIQLALTAAWSERGVEPDLCIGHSMGEVAAAHACGALSLADAAAVICRRSALMKRLAGRGAMLSVDLPADAAARAAAPYDGAVCVAAENSPTSTVLAGPAAELDDLAHALERRGVFHRFVRVDVASHSPDMDRLREDLRIALADLSPAAPAAALLSTVHCAPIADGELDAAYWTENLRRPVRFADALRIAAAHTENVFVEISPHPVLTGAIEDTLADADAPSAVVASLRRDRDEPTELARALGQLFGHGGRIAWERWFGTAVRPVPLPHYAWDEQSLYHRPASQHARGRRTHDVRFDGRVAQVSLRGVTPLPATAQLTAVLDAARAAAGGEFAIEQVRLHGGLLDVSQREEVTVRVTLEAPDGGGARRAVAEIPDVGAGRTGPHLQALVRPASAAESTPRPFDIDGALSRCRDYLPSAAFYRGADARGLDIHPGLRSIDRLWRTDGEAIARMRRPEGPEAAALEAGMHTLLAALPAGGAADAATCLYLPESMGCVRLFQALTEEFWSHTTFTARRGGRPAHAEVVLAAADGRPLACFRSVVLRRLPGAARARAALHLPGRWVAAPLGVVAAGSSKLLSSLGRRLTVPAHTSAWAPAPSGGKAPGAPSADLVPLVATGPERARIRDREEDPLLRGAAVVLGVPVESFDLRRPLCDYGLDSLMAAQLRQQLLRQGREVSISELLGPQSLRSLLQIGAAATG